NKNSPGLEAQGYNLTGVSQNRVKTSELVVQLRPCSRDLAGYPAKSAGWGRTLGGVGLGPEVHEQHFGTDCPIAGEHVLDTSPSYPTDPRLRLRVLNPGPPLGSNLAKSYAAGNVQKRILDSDSRATTHCRDPSESIGIFATTTITRELQLATGRSVGFQSVN